MSWEERYFTRPKNPVQVMHDGIAKGWHNGISAVYEGGETALTATGWAVTHPFQAMDKMGDFAHDGAVRRWGQLTDLFGAGVMAWNMIVDVWEQPCEGKWGVVIELATPIAGNTLLILLTPSITEILEEYLDPKQSRSGSRRKRRKQDQRRKKGKSGRRRRGFGGPPDVDGMIAAIIPGAAFMAARNSFGPTRWFFAGIAIADLDAISWMLVDLTSDGLIQWTSAVRQARFCSAEFNVGYVGEQVAPLQGNGGLGVRKLHMDPDEGTNLTWLDLELQYPGTVQNNAEIQVNWSGKITNLSDEPAGPFTVNMRIESVVFDSQERPQLAPGESSEFNLIETTLISPLESLRFDVQPAAFVPGDGYSISDMLIMIGGKSPPP